MTERSEEEEAGQEDLESDSSPTTARPVGFREHLLSKVEAGETRVDHLSDSERKLHQKVDDLRTEVHAIVAGVGAHVDRALAESAAESGRALQAVRTLVDDVRREVRADIILSKAHVDEVIHVQQTHGTMVAELAENLARQGTTANNRMNNIAAGAAEALAKTMAPRDKELADLRRITAKLTESVRALTAKHDDIPDPQEVTKIRVMPPIPQTVEARLAATVVARHELEVDVARKDAAHKDRIKKRLVWALVFCIQAAVVWATTRYLGTPPPPPRMEAAPPDRP